MAQQLNYEFNGKVAFITGAATGIGRATALAFGKAGAQVAVVDLNTDSGLRTVHMIQDADGKAEFIQCDVSKAEDVKRAIDQTIKLFGRIDYAFNNAGIEGAQAFTPDCTEKNWDEVININLKGVWLCMKYQIPRMLAQGGGAIVNCSSVAGLIGFPGIPAYVASKHGVIGLTKTAALEYAKSNIRVNAISPGVIQTPMIDRFVHGEAQIQNQLVAGEPVGRVGQPEEVAAAALWLCSDSASFVTGHSLAVDGGWVAQ
ncbi:MAG TPA: SDR family oxidoreductase [Bdellovibrionales bacterium]|nr:SDR family oxidoreductase [Bdellovibrionales bacterium]